MAMRFAPYANRKIFLSGRRKAICVLPEYCE